MKINLVISHNLVYEKLKEYLQEYLEEISFSEDNYDLLITDTIEEIEKKALFSSVVFIQLEDNLNNFKPNDFFHIIPVPFSMEDVISVINSNKLIWKNSVRFNNFKIILYHDKGVLLYDKDDSISLNLQEIMVLKKLFENNCSGVLKNDLLKDVWNIQDDKNLNTKVLENTIFNLRKKLHENSIKLTVSIKDRVYFIQEL